MLTRKKKKDRFHHIWYEAIETDCPYSWSADLMTRAHSLFGVPWYKNLQY